MKIYISLVEFILKATILLIITTALRGTIGPIVFYYLTRVYLVVYILYFFYLVSMVLNRRKLPGKSYKSFLGFIELHIDKSNKGSRKKFYVACADTILAAHELKKNVLFDTWLIQPEELQNRLGDSVERRKCPLTVRVLFKLLKGYYSSDNEESKKKEMHRYIIHTDKLNEDNIRYLRRMSSKKERVIN